MIFTICGHHTVENRGEIESRFFADGLLVEPIGDYTNRIFRASRLLFSAWAM